jgi:hypothetical protein
MGRATPEDEGTAEAVRGRDVGVGCLEPERPVRSRALVTGSEKTARPLSSILDHAGSEGARRRGPPSLFAEERIDARVTITELLEDRNCQRKLFRPAR